ncbi:MAG: hypothetical protein BRD44_07305 [Bacteroidetes bacterium QS_7_67_15]|nr:MAG: hypothetical protein BRD44_07305 [Bacteroidetes bacterium QS_7_67_15]
MDVLDVLARTVAAVAVAASVWLAWRASRELVRGAREDAHGTARASRRLWAHRMRLFAFTGLSAVVVGVLAGVRNGVAAGGFAAGSTLWLSVGLLLSGLLAWVSARASGRASRHGDKRSHVHARLRFQRWREQQQRRRRRQQRHSRPREGPAGHRQRSQRQRSQRDQATAREARRRAEVRRALRTLRLSAEATPEEIKRAWREQAFRHHPDRHASASDAAREEHAAAFRQARRAYETLRRDA